MADIQILNKETIPGTKYTLQMITYNKPDLNGNFHEQKSEVYFRPDAVAVLLVDHENKKILLTRQFRMPAYLNGNDTGYLVEACAGLIDEDETPKQTAIREAEEETGYQLENIINIAGVYSSAGGITEFLHLFTASYNSKGPQGKSGGLAAEGEDIGLIELSFAEAKEKLLSGEFKDAKTVMLLQHFFMNKPSK